MPPPLYEELAKAAEFLEAVEGSAQRQVFIHAKITKITPWEFCLAGEYTY